MPRPQGGSFDEFYYDSKKLESNCDSDILEKSVLLSFDEFFRHDLGNMIVKFVKTNIVGHSHNM